MSKETLDLMLSLNRQELEIQIALQCAPLLTGRKISNLLTVDRSFRSAVLGLFRSSAVSCYVLYESADRITFLLYVREKLEAYVRNRYDFFGYGFYSVLLKTTGELAAWAGFQEREYHGKTVLEFGYLTAAAFRKQGIATEAAGILVREMEELTGETQAYLFCHPDNQPSRKTAEKLCALYPEHFQTVVDQEKADSRKL